MSFSSLKFGDVFRYFESEYVFLAHDLGVVYAIKILGQLDSEKILSRDDKRAVQDMKSRLGSGDSILFCYVVLRTEDYQW